MTSTGIISALASSLRRPASHPQKKKEHSQRSCIACTDKDVPLVRPCRTCELDYCIGCLVQMFSAATNDRSRMPPQCCSLIQIHTVLDHLAASEAEAYRIQFEEWITPVKTYCPSPTCSTFIPERRLPDPQTAKGDLSLSGVLNGVIMKVSLCPSARFFRGEMDITQLPGYTAVVKCPMHLGTIKEHIAASRYKSTFQLTKDMQLILDNARAYNGTQHPVTTAATELFTQYLHELSHIVDRLVMASTSTTSSLFTCPKCHIAICSACKQVEHAGPCDTSAVDHEIAMLQTFGYKRCPRCKAGVKKMYGCSHMQCTCGAHWCWYCLKSVNECYGDCEDYDSDIEDELSDEEGLEDGEIPRNLVNRPPAPAPAPVPNDQIANLDAGGARRWAEGNHNFGAEPDDPLVISQVWSCNHYFVLYRVPSDDGFDRGDFDRMECNRCFDPVSAYKASKKRRRSAVQSQGATPAPDGISGEKREAWECSRCRLLVCVLCKGKYGAA